MQIDFVNDNNIKILLPEGFDEFNNLMKTRPEKEKGFRQIISLCIEKKLIVGNIIDLGAWIGDNSLPWSKMISLNKLVYAIDPSPNNIQYIKKLKEINNSENVICIQEAISNKIEELKYGGSIDHTTFVENGLNNEIPHSSIKSTYLDKLYSEGIIKNIDFIHLDVEGMEFIVLQGAQKLIQNNKPIIAYEVHLDLDKFQKDIYKYLTNLGYFVWMIDEILPGCRTDCRNLIAVPIEKYTSFIENMNNILVPVVFF
jgi:FkbM family methyltransferase